MNTAGFLCILVCLSVSARQLLVRSQERP
jgi:hypothetical protein